MWGVEELRWKLGASRLYSLHYIQKQALIIVIHEGDCRPSVPESSCSTDLRTSCYIRLYRHIYDKNSSDGGTKLSGVTKVSFEPYRERVH